jgi:hypothetical protein
MRRLLGLTMMLALCASPASAATITPFIDLQETGLTLSGTAAGANTLGSGSLDLTLSIDGTVRFGLLYWTGSESCAAPCSISQPYGDQQVIFDSTAITGTLIGVEEASGFANIGYFADVTSLVSAAGVGTHAFSFADGNLSNNLDTLDGVGLIVGYTDPNDATTTRVMIFDGLDLIAAGGSSTIQFNYGGVTFDRAAELWLLGGNGTSAPSDYVQVASGPQIGNPFSGSSGSSFDLYRRQFTVSAGTASTSVQVGSLDCGASSETLRWEVGALILRQDTGTASGGATAAPSCVSTVPEPGVLALLSSGALAAGLGRWRRRARR